ncbi:MAG: tyrosine-type recombinase/integrase [Sphingomonas bacterium]|nr:tyrosine-type recombinase/integrase [Sphingomonas bacterium]
MSRSNVTQRLDLAVAAAGLKHPGILEHSVTPHVVRHTTAMHLLQSGVDITVIALWLGHEDTATTHMYVEADLAMKERALMKLQPSTAAAGRFHASDNLLSFLQSL